MVSQLWDHHCWSIHLWNSTIHSRARPNVSKRYQIIIPNHHVKDIYIYCIIYIYHFYHNCSSSLLKCIIIFSLSLWLVCCYDIKTQDHVNPCSTFSEDERWQRHSEGPKPHRTHCDETLRRCCGTFDAGIGWYIYMLSNMLGLVLCNIYIMIYIYIYLYVIYDYIYNIYMCM